MRQALQTALTRIYPNGRGHYALGSPDGSVLLPGQPLTVLVAGHQIAGTVAHSDQGDYLRAEDETICGLCARMQVVPSAQTRINGDKLGAWVRQDRCWIDQRDGEVIIGNHFAIFRLPADSLPDFLQPAHDGLYEYDGQVLREEEEEAQWLRLRFQDALGDPTKSRCRPIETIDCPVFGQRYRALIDEEVTTHWMDASILEILASTLSGLAEYRFEAIAPNRFRIFAPDGSLPIAIASERVKREVAR